MGYKASKIDRQHTTLIIPLKYLFAIAFLLSCRSEQRKVIIPHIPGDTSVQIPVKRDSITIDIHDPFETGKDTVRLNAMINKLSKFPEVRAIQRQIEKSSKGKHGVSFMVQDEFNGDTSYYDIMVGDNSHEDMYHNIFNFLLEKKTNQIKVYDTILDSILSVRDWRKRRN